MVMKTRDYIVYFILVVVFAMLICMFNYHNTRRLDAITERIDNISDSICIANKAYPCPVFLPDAERHRDKRGNYWLSEQDFVILEKALLYHNKRIETICSEVRSEVSNDMTRLNTWITLWMGILAVLGVFVPIVINITSTRNIEKEIETQNDNLNIIRSDASLAKTKADGAQEAVENCGTLVEKVNATASELKDTTNNIASNVVAYQKAFSELQEKVNDASQKSEEASDSVIAIKSDVEWAKISIRLVYSLGILKDIENSYRIAYQLGKDKSFIVKHNVDNAVSIFEDLKKYNEDLGIDPQRNKLIKSIMSDFVLAFQKMQTFFNKREQLDAIQEINNAITTFLGLTMQPNDNRADALQKIIATLLTFKESL